MRRLSCLMLASLCLVATSEAHSMQTANILDLIYWDIGKPAEGVETRNDAQQPSAEGDGDAADVGEPPKTCRCSGPACLCCVDFNITYIDLGGPGCVNMRYVSQTEGVSVNVSYGDSVLQSAQIRGGPNPQPACISLLGSLAQVCARFSKLETLDDGLKGCLLLEPKLLGDIQTQFSIGCFNMDPKGMRVDENANVTNEDTSPSNGSDVTNLSEEDILTAVKESAQQGLAFFENFFGLSLEATDKNDNGTANEDKTGGTSRPPLQLKATQDVKNRR